MDAIFSVHALGALEDAEVSAVDRMNLVYLSHQSLRENLVATLADHPELDARLLRPLSEHILDYRD